MNVASLEDERNHPVGGIEYRAVQDYDSGVSQDTELVERNLSAHGERRTSVAPALSLGRRNSGVD